MLVRLAPHLRESDDDLFEIHVPLMPNIPGLRSCYDKVGRLIYFGRMLDKIRLHAAGQLPPDYQENLGEPHPVHSRRTLLPFPRRPLLRDQEAHARRRARRSRPELGARPRHPAHRRRVPRLESLHRQARLARRTQPRPPAAHPGERPPGKPIETLIDHIEFDEGRDPVAARAWEKI